MRATKPQAGFTVIEMLVTIAILSIVLGIISSFLIGSMRLAEQTEARNEMQVNLRSAMELISTDLYSAGSNGVQFGCTFDWDAPTTPAFESPAVSSTNPPRHKLTVRYCDPYTGDATTVSYELRQDTNNGNLWTLYRKLNSGNYQPAIPGILAFEMVFTCDPTGSTLTSGAPSYICDPKVPTTVPPSFYPDDVVSVTIKLTAQSTRKAQGVSSTCTFIGGSCTAEPGYYYEYAEQAVSTPNLGN